MLYLRDLPTRQHLEGFAARYAGVDPSASEACLAMLRIVSDVFSAMEEYLAAHGVSQGRFTVLMILNREPHRSLAPSELAGKAGVTRATMTGLLDGLEREGLVARQSDPRDRRMVGVRLTPRGIRYLDRRLPDYFARVSQLMSGLSRPQRVQLVQLLQKVAAGIPALNKRQKRNGSKR